MGEFYHHPANADAGATTTAATASRTIVNANIGSAATASAPRTVRNSDAHAAASPTRSDVNRDAHCSAPSARRDPDAYRDRATPGDRNDIAAIGPGLPRDSESGVRDRPAGRSVVDEPAR